MIQPVDTILALVLLSVLISFGSSRLPMLIKVLAFQGVIVFYCAVVYRPRSDRRQHRVRPGHPDHPGNPLPAVYLSGD